MERPGEHLGSVIVSLSFAFSLTLSDTPIISLAILTFLLFIYHTPFSAAQVHNKRGKENYAVVRADCQKLGRGEEREVLERLRRGRVERESAERGSERDEGRGSQADSMLLAFVSPLPMS
jgi:hypothetical protein